MLCFLVVSSIRAGSIANFDPCSLNGVIKGGVCECDQGWRGLRCSQLNLIPAIPTNLGYRNASLPTWYGSIIKEKGHGERYHMFAVARAVAKRSPFDDYFGASLFISCRKVLCTRMDIESLRIQSGIHMPTVCEPI